MDTAGLLDLRMRGYWMASAEESHIGGSVLAKEAFKHDVGSLPVIRDFVGKWAAAAGLDEDQTYRMKLAVEEACANAIENPVEKSDLTLWAWNNVDRFTVDVWHAGEFRVKTGLDRRHSGMGLPLMVGSVDAVSFACLPEGGVRVSLSVLFAKKPPPTSGMHGEVRA